MFDIVKEGGVQRLFDGELIVQVVLWYLPACVCKKIVSDLFSFLIWVFRKWGFMYIFSEGCAIPRTMMYVCNQEDWFIPESYSVGGLFSLVVIYSRMAEKIGKYSVSRLNSPSCDLILSSGVGI